MKIKILIPAMALMAITACNRSQNKAAQNSNGQDTAAQKVSSDSKTTPEQGPGVYFVNLKDGDKVKSPVIIEMGVKGMEVEPAGKTNEGKGHHHIIIDGSFVEAGQMVPKDETHLHFGKGQTADTLQLKTGHHTLTLQFANGMHQSYGKDWSKTIGIDVIE